MNNHLKTFTFVHRTEEFLVGSTSVGSYLIIFPYANRVDPDQAALTRAALSGSSTKMCLYERKD